MVARSLRNLTSELINGATDGAVKKSRPDWSQIVNDTTEEARQDLPTGGGSGGGYDWSPVDGNKSEYVRGYVRGA